MVTDEGGELVAGLGDRDGAPNCRAEDPLMSAISFVARPRRPRWHVMVAGAFILATVAGGLIDGVVPVRAESATGAISGVAFQDLDRDGSLDSGEVPFVDHLVYLFDDSGSFAASRRTDASGAYRFGGLSTGADYTVSYAPTAWWEIWEEWVPTTTGSLLPEHVVEATEDETRADFGWRPIITSDDVHNPLSEVTGPQGLRVQSYNDAVTATEIYDHIATEFLLGDEAGDVTVRFARPSNTTNSVISKDSDGDVTHVRSTVNTTYTRWLRSGDRLLAHEYGHAWMNHHNYLVRQDDGTWSEFLTARGIDPNDDRLGSSHAWHPAEIAAEDYRQLFTSENARTGGQMNGDIPRPWDVPGFEDFLLTSFREADAPPADEEEPTGDPTEEPTGEPTEEPNPGDGDSTDTPDEPITLDVQVGKRKGQVYADLTWAGFDVSDILLFRNGEAVSSIPNTGTHRDETGLQGSPDLVYRVCDLAGERCSDPVTADDEGDSTKSPPGQQKKK